MDILSTSKPPEAVSARIILGLTPISVTVPNLGNASISVYSSHIELQFINSASRYVSKARLGKRPPVVQTSYFQGTRIEVYLEVYSSSPDLAFTCSETRLASLISSAIVELQSIVVSSASALSTPVVGVAAIVKRQEDRIQHESSVASESFSDLQQLKARAAEVTMVIERCAAVLRKKSTAVDSDLAAFDDLLASVGVISNPVAASRRLGGTASSFSTSLAKEIALFLKSQDSKSSHWSLADVFAMYNRARGGAGLVSPSDVLTACRAMKECDCGFELVENEATGVKIVRATTSKFNQGALDYCQKVKPGPISAVKLAKEVGVPLTVAKDWLLKQEDDLKLCRDDDHLGNLFFYTNLFV